MKILQGDCLEKIKKMEDNSVDTIITDPPYGLSFMGKKWDYDVPSVEIWKEALRVLKPGGTALIFAGSRTQHRMAVNVEDAGFILKDTIMWLYGSGFPKATDISKQLDKKGGRSIGKDVADLIKNKRLELGYSTIKIAELGGFYSKTNHGGTVSNWETGRGEITLKQFNKLIDILGLDSDPIVEAEREVIGKQKNAMSGWNTDGSTKFKDRDITIPTTPEAKLWNGWKSHGLKPAYEPILVCQKPNEGTYANNALKWGVSGLNIDGGRIGTEDTRSKTSGAIEGSGWGTKGGAIAGSKLGRFPANIILDEEAGRLLDEQSGVLGSNSLAIRKTKNTGGSGNVYKTSNDNIGNIVSRGDKGGASRFFKNIPLDSRIIYTPKASKKERNAGLDRLEEKQKVFNGQSNKSSKELKDVEERFTTKPSANFHPTVKPLKLMEYLCTLTKTPTGGIVLDPFAGSGTTGVACLNTGRDFILIEREEEYIPIIKARIEAVKLQPKQDKLL